MVSDFTRFESSRCSAVTAGGPEGSISPDVVRDMGTCRIARFYVTSYDRPDGKW